MKVTALKEIVESLSETTKNLACHTLVILAVTPSVDGDPEAQSIQMITELPDLATVDLLKMSLLSFATGNTVNADSVN